MKIRVTHVGTATVILDIGTVRLITDPSFDPAGGRYTFAPIGASSNKLEAAAIERSALGRVDAALITHAQHADNLDTSGRALLEEVNRVVTSRASARLLGDRAEGLREWQSTEIVGSAGERIRVTATPARHGPPASLPFVGKVIGFLLEWQGQDHGALYISGDTVWFRGIAEIARRHRVSLAILHLGEARLPITGPFRLTMNGRQAAHAAEVLGARTVVPVHYDGWTHFREPKSDAHRAFEEAAISDKVHWLIKGTPTEIDV
jgi:L-ascorbate metabolism protein UlaG (beta-lactamase superfamily)